MARQTTKQRITNNKCERFMVKEREEHGRKRRERRRRLENPLGLAKDERRMNGK